EPTKDWLAVRGVADEPQEVVVLGWRPGRDGGSVGALLVGVPGEAGPRYAGTVTTGLTRAAAEDLLPRLRRLARRTPPVDGVPPARDVRWVTPRLAGEVAHGGRTPDGRLRKPRWLGLRG